MIVGYKPILNQGIRLVTENGEANHIETIQGLGWCLLSYDTKRFRRIMTALESSGISQASFIAQAIESYAFSIEHAACFPELRDHLTQAEGLN